jgi:Tol biopolymer transport system component
MMSIKMAKIARLLLLCCASMISLLIQAQSTEGDSPLHLAYVAEGQLLSDIFIVDLDTFEIRNMTNRLDSDYSPDWNADGTRVIYTTFVNGNNEIAIIDTITEQLDVFQHPESNELAPTWSNDGSNVIFSSDKNGTNQIYVLDILSESIEQVTNTEFDAVAPDWLHDDDGFIYLQTVVGDDTVRRDVFYRGFGEEPIVLVKGYEQNLRPLGLPSDNYGIFSPKISPDGKQLVYVFFFVTDRIILHDIASNSQRTLTDINNNYSFPEWSPDGHCISFTQFTDSVPDGIWVYDLRTDETIELPIEHNDAYDLAWAGNTTCDDVLHWAKRSLFL